jgi:hypothetical protein
MHQSVHVTLRPELDLAKLSINELCMCERALHSNFVRLKVVGSQCVLLGVLLGCESIDWSPHLACMVLRRSAWNWVCCYAKFWPSTGLNTDPGCSRTNNNVDKILKMCASFFLPSMINKDGPRCRPFGGKARCLILLSSRILVPWGSGGRFCLDNGSGT